jgi:hypothetical protein
MCFILMALCIEPNLKIDGLAAKQESKARGNRYNPKFKRELWKWERKTSNGRNEQQYS